MSEHGTLQDDTSQALPDRFGDVTIHKAVLTISWSDLLSLFLDGCRVPMETSDEIGEDVAAGTRHRHGAAPDQVSVHIAMQEAWHGGRQADRLEPVGDGSYARPLGAGQMAGGRDDGVVARGNTDVGRGLTCV